MIGCNRHWRMILVQYPFYFWFVLDIYHIYIYNIHIYQVKSKVFNTMHVRDRDSCIRMHERNTLIVDKRTPWMKSNYVAITISPNNRVQKLLVSNGNWYWNRLKMIFAIESVFGVWQCAMHNRAHMCNTIYACCTKCDIKCFFHPHAHKHTARETDKCTRRVWHSMVLLTHVVCLRPAYWMFTCLLTK